MNSHFIHHSNNNRGNLAVAGGLRVSAKLRELSGLVE